MVLTRYHDNNDFVLGYYHRIIFALCQRQKSFSDYGQAQSHYWINSFFIFSWTYSLYTRLKLIHYRNIFPTKGIYNPPGPVSMYCILQWDTGCTFTVEISRGQTWHALFASQSLHKCKELSFCQWKRMPGLFRSVMWGGKMVYKNNGITKENVWDPFNPILLMNPLSPPSNSIVTVSTQWSVLDDILYHVLFIYQFTNLSTESTQNQLICSIA